MDKLQFECRFCGTLTEISIETGYYQVCDCGAYSAVILESQIDEQKNEIAEKFNLPSPQYLVYNYKIIYYRKDPLILFWAKKAS